MNASAPPASEGGGREVLIIGSAGYVGTRMAAGFIRAGYRVAGLQRPGGTPIDPAHRAVPGDLADPDSLVAAARGFAWVINLGAILGEEVDMASTRALIESGSPLIHTSGSDVLGAGSTDEFSTPRPHPLVGWRDRVERLVLEAGGRVIRPGLIYGSGGGVVNNMMIPLARRLGEGIYIGEPDVRWAAVHVEDLPSLYLAVARSAGPGTVWNAVSDNVWVDKLVELVGGGRARSWPVDEDPPEEYLPIAGLFRLDQVVSAERTKRELGWVPQHTDVLVALAQEFAAQGVRPGEIPQEDKTSGRFVLAKPERRASRPGLRAMADLATPMAIRVAATLRLADHVAAGRRTAAEIAAAAGVHAGALDRMMRHLVALGLFTRDAAGAYTATELGEQLRDDHPGGRRKWLDIEGGVGKGDLSFVDLEHSIRTGEPSYQVRNGIGFWDDLAANPPLSESFDTVMQHHIQLDNENIAEAYDWSALGHVVDVGGGNGALLSALLTRYTGLRGTLLDLEGPAANARRTFQEHGLTDRAEAVAGSFFDPLPPGADAYLLSAIVHDWDDESAVRILRRCAEAAGEKGRILLVEAVGADGESPDPVMDLRMLVYYGGKERGVTELSRLAAEAGLALRARHAVGRGSYMSIVEFAAG